MKGDKNMPNNKKPSQKTEQANGTNKRSINEGIRKGYQPTKDLDTSTPPGHGSSGSNQNNNR